VAIGDTIAIFDETNSYPFHHEERDVLDVQTSPNPNASIITLDSSLSRPYYSSSKAVNNEPDFSNLHSAGIGVISSCDEATNQINATDSCFYDGDMREIEKVFSDAFIELYAPLDGVGAVPTLPEPFFTASVDEPITAQDAFSRTWFQNWTDYAGNPQICTPNNYFHLIGASFSSRAGLAHAWSNTSFVFVGTIGATASAPGVPFINYVRWVSHHELGHQFELNPCICDFHDTRAAWCYTHNNCNNPGLSHSVACIMTVITSDDREDGVDRFCELDLFFGTSGCTGVVCSPTDTRNYSQGYGAIRTMPDPR
jgi:hypothetical protein